MKITGDLDDPRWLYLKGFLFLLTGILAAGILLMQSPTLRTALLLGIAVWSFCRWYYFLFYVIEKYVDPGFRYASITTFELYLLRQRKKGA